MKPFSLIFVFFLLTSFTIKKAIEIDKEQLDEVVVNYTSLINRIQSENSMDGYRDLLAITNSKLAKLGFQSNDLIQVGINDLDGLVQNLETYSRIVAQSYENQVFGEFDYESIKVMDDCPIYVDGHSVILISINKSLEYKNKKAVLEYLLGINVDSPKYALAFALIKNVSYSEFPESAKCISDTEALEAKRKLNDRFNTIFKEAENFYNNNDYVNALAKFEEANKIISTNQDTIDAIKNCKIFIEEDIARQIAHDKQLYITNTKKHFAKLIDDKKYQQALSDLTNLTNEDIINNPDNWYQTKIAECKAGLQRSTDEAQLYSADILFKANRYDEAQQRYKKLLGSNFIDQNYINKQIKACKESDPLFIQKELQKAFDAAVKSKKNYYSTFKTYTKYESTGLLSAKQYYFMCLMMINKHKVVAKPMGYTKNQAAILSRVYFYKCRNLGKDVSFLENQIFTKSINKN